MNCAYEQNTRLVHNNVAGINRAARDLHGAGCMIYEVIRITCHDEAALTRLVLEGKLAGACVDELDKCWRNSRNKLLIDLTSVSFIDDRGKQLLKRMHEHGATLISSSIMSRCLIEELNS